VAPIAPPTTPAPTVTPSSDFGHELPLPSTNTDPFA
jgi:hypothetical protein